VGEGREAVCERRRDIGRKDSEMIGSGVKDNESQWDERQ
jgi:hypothetical protein